MSATEMSDIETASKAVSERSRSGAARRLIVQVAAVVNFSGATIVVLTLSTMFLAILANVILRYFFGSGITWAYEIPAILFPWGVAGGLVMATAQGRNITVDALVKVLPEPVRRLLAILINLFIGLTSAGVVYYSLPIVKASQYSRLAETGISQIYGYTSLIYAFSMIAVIALLTVLEFLLGRRAEAADPSEAHFS
ncbi:TRAP transporter small permease [Marinobacterium aestuariivivens]|uniref:TRAP transporter small permease protein n=1 Tax=Marinobacterium aestuariivivens TaxID=1698799 RepID=A0ABW2A1L6_9GAMM